MFQTVNIKDGFPSVEEAIARFEIALSEAVFLGSKVLKVVHGYGSHGVGGAILVEFKKCLNSLKRKKKIVDFIGGAMWSLSNKQVFDLILRVPSCAQDEDLNKGNIGVTIVIIK